MFHSSPINTLICCLRLSGFFLHSYTLYTAPPMIENDTRWNT
uniref:Uncharacterized protein n=1 Tax=Arundo donax TaxID=35708 RepID=A0A0A9H6Q1_ARUDO